MKSMPIGARKNSGTVVGGVGVMADGAYGLQLTEDRAEGMRFTLLPDTIVDLG